MTSLVQIAYQPKPLARDPVSGAQTANHANSTSPSSATLANATAGYTTLGGRFQFAAVAGAATDYALFAYQVRTGYRALLHGLNISTVNTGAAVATTATILDWSIGIDGTAVDLSTADNGSTVFATRRIPIGIQSFLVGEAIGTQANDLSIWFPSPLLIEAGRYIHLILQMPVATATGSQVIRGDATFACYSEQVSFPS